MPRLTDVPSEEMTEFQKRVFAEIAGPRGGTVRGPFAIWMRQPELADKANQFGNALRVHGKLDKRLFELMVLIVARHYSAQYEWFAHEDAARKAGLADPIIEELRNGRAPEFVRTDERLVYEMVTELNEKRTLTQPTYDQGVSTFGLDLMIELVTSIGFYTLVAITLNAFDAPVPGGSKPLP